MKNREALRRDLLRSFVALPVMALLSRPGLAAAQTSKVVVFQGVQKNIHHMRGADFHLFGWAAETPQGWIGRVVDATVAAAMSDFPGFAAETVMVVPKGTPNTINGHMSKDGVRGSSVCFAEITGGTVTGSVVKLVGKLSVADNPVIHKSGDPVSLEANRETGEINYVIRAAGQDRPHRAKGHILIV